MAYQTSYVTNEVSIGMIEMGLWDMRTGEKGIFNTKIKF